MLQRKMLLVASVVLVVPVMLAGSVHAQTTPPSTQTVGIPGAVTLPDGSTVVFSHGSQSLTVVSGIPSGLPGLDASVAYDGASLTIEVPQLRFAEVNVQPPDDPTCINLNGRSNAVRCLVTASPNRAPFVFEIVAGKHPSFPCPDVSLAPSWNLISGALAHNINTNLGPLYTYQAGDRAYEAVASVQDAVDTAGYWVLFAQSTPVFDFDLSRFGGCRPPSLQPAGPLMLALPPGRWVLIGNPFGAATITGADAVLTYDPVRGYVPSDSLSLGQGAWAYSATGGEATLTPSP